ncbi:alpha/beta hydrolase [Ureibacillus chungkukjangi]|uniref:Enterochelin esterase-like enzyme n=1 Tax=Ureibacillus chungkukjangi TaxID=1202712 RepID=A0A318TWX9_9BACL|nr:alpha/beta hydrolase-fold protein [Ureibacillus chungkukjangi]PYF06505.1 enterochelin esterase-like enzyme [Ureibacillus chungkukjangi]
MEHGTIKEISFFSTALNEEQELLIYVPANYTPLNKYHILIASDGKDYFQLGGISRLADQLLDEYEIENIIIVGIPYKSVGDRRRKYIPTGELHDAYLRFLAHELVPYLDEEYSTYQLGSTRGVIGDSMAATVSLIATLKYPAIFSKAILQSPYVDEHVLKIVEKSNNMNTVSIYHVIGTGEDKVVTTDKQIKDFLTPNRQLHTLLKSKGYTTFYEEFDGNHTWKYWKPDLKRALIKNFS